MYHPAPSTDLILALYHRAVLPSMAQLVKLDPDSLRAAGDKPWSVRLYTPGGPFTVISFDGKELVHGAQSARSPLTLRFWSQAHALRTFRGGSALPPIPTAGWLQLPMARYFSRMTDRLASIMNDPTRDPELRTRLLFGGLVARAAVELCQRQTEARALLHQYGDFMAEFTIEGEAQSWFGHHQQQFKAGPGAAPRAPTLVLGFANLETACEAALGTLDQMAAVGGGRVTVTGLTPLADSLDILLDRIASYLQ